MRIIKEVVSLETAFNLDKMSFQDHPGIHFWIISFDGLKAPGRSVFIPFDDGGETGPHPAVRLLFAALSSPQSEMQAMLAELHLNDPKNDNIDH